MAVEPPPEYRKVWAPARSSDDGDPLGYICHATTLAANAYAHARFRGRHVSRSFEVRQEFGMSAAQVRAMMIDPAYIRLRAERTGAIRVDIENVSDLSGGEISDADQAAPVRLQITRVLPTKDAPAFARSLLGDSITVTETQTWPPVIAGTANASMEAAFGSLVRLTARIELTDDSGGSVVVTRADCKASVPLVGGKVEALIEEQVREYLAYEVRVAGEWLAGSGS